MFAAKLPDYFPAQLRGGYREAIFEHPLRREITTTIVVNEVVDLGGVSFAFLLIEELAASATDAVRAFPWNVLDDEDAHGAAARNERAARES